MIACALVSGCAHGGTVLPPPLPPPGDPPDQAEVIALHWLDGLSFPEVAEVVGATLSAVKVRAHRGYAAMRAYLDRDVGNPGSKSGIEP